MTFINWSDPEEMLGLLAEFIADERSESAGFPERRAALDRIFHDVSRLAATEPAPSIDELIDRLRDIEAAHDDLRGDSVHEHVVDCIGELVRIRRAAEEQ